MAFIMLATLMKFYFGGGGGGGEKMDE